MNSPDERTLLDFDRNGPRVGSTPLLRKTVLGFRHLAVEELADLLPDQTDLAAVVNRLDRIAYAMNVGDLALAGVATAQLSSVVWPVTATSRHLRKASVDDPRHPGYPAGEPGGKGGQFRPKDTSDGAAEDRAEEAKRLAYRRSVRLALKRVLSVKRLLRLAAENAAALFTEPVPGLDAAVTGAALADDLATFKELADDIADAGATVKLAEDAPVELQSLQRGNPGESFPSFDAFKKFELEKQFGSAEYGCDYHHLVEQGPNAGTIPDFQLQSTDNIVEIPRLLHEEINSHYATPQLFNDGLMTPRSFLQGKSFDVQRTYGIDVLRSLGAVK